jgi:hypothetical protein
MKRVYAMYIPFDEVEALDEQPAGIEAVEVEMISTWRAIAWALAWPRTGEVEGPARAVAATSRWASWSAWEARRSRRLAPHRGAPIHARSPPRRLCNTRATCQKMLCRINELAMAFR